MLRSLQQAKCCERRDQLQPEKLHMTAKTVEQISQNTGFLQNNGTNTNKMKKSNCKHQNQTNPVCEKTVFPKGLLFYDLLCFSSLALSRRWSSGRLHGEGEKKHGRD